MSDREWLGFAQDEIDRLREAKGGYPHTQKMVNTILALVDARLAGSSETAVLGQPETCSANIYHTKWKHDPDFATCLAGVTEVARKWHDGRALRAIEEASEQLALLAPTAAKLAGLAMKGNNHMDTRLRAAFGVLDRAGLKTATKSQNVVSDADLNKILDRLTTEELERFGSGDDLIDIILDRTR